MILRRLTIIITFLTAWVWSNGQQINAVPDYVFRNQMSVGRNAVTDTAAYFSIGPRYGANKGFMPPIVGDTATFSSGKRNGLLIFSVQKNKFLYWDSVRVQWSDMAGSSGSYIVAGDTASMLTPYVRHAGYGLTKSSQSFLIDTLNIATRAWRQKGLDSLAALEVSGSGTTNYVPKFTASSTIGNSQIFDNGTRVGIGTASPAAKVDIRGSGLQDLYFISSTVTNVENTIQSYFNSGGAWADLSTKSQNLIFNTGPSGGPQAERLRITSGGDVGIGTDAPNARITVQAGASVASAMTFRANNVTSTSELFVGQSIGNDAFFYNRANAIISLGTNNTERMRIFANGRIGINTTTDAGYQLDVNGTFRAQGGSALSTSVFSNTGFDGGIDISNTGTLAANRTAQIRITNGTTFFGANDRSYQLINIGESATAAAFAVQYYNGTTFSERLRINSSGNVGIGTASPLAVANYTGLTLSGTNGSFTSLYTGASQIARIEVNTTSDFTIKSIANVPLILGTNNTENVRITTSGNVGIGTASPGFKLSVKAATDYNIGIGILGNYASINVLNDAASAYKELRIDGSYIYQNTYSGGKTILNTTTDAGDYKLQVAGNIYGSGLAVIGNAIINTNSPFVTGANIYTNGQSLALGTQGANLMSFFTNNAERGRINSAGEWIIDASGTDAGDYKLQVVGNARVGTGKLDIVTNTAFGLSVSRSGTDVVAQQINNSTGILYYGAESSTGGALFTGSSAYAAVIGSGANYPLQFASNNITRATLNTSGELQIGSTSDVGDYKLQVIGNGYFGGSITTNAPDGGNAKPWKLGSVIATTVILDTANYVEVEINGVAYKLALVTPN